MNRTLDEMIKAYSDELMQFARENNTESLIIKSTVPENTDEEQAYEEKEEEPVSEEPVRKEAEEASAEVGETREIPAEEDMKSFADFRGRVLTGFGALPVEGARIILYRGDVLYAFLVTDKNGMTEKIKIEAYPEKNSLEPLSDEQRTDYTADVYAEGFSEKKNLLVSAVGGSEVVLEVELTPESEVIS